MILLLLHWKKTEANIHQRECLARVLHCFVAYWSVVSAQPLYSIGSDRVRSVWEVDEIQIWQRDKWLILTWHEKGTGRREWDRVSPRGTLLWKWRTLDTERGRWREGQKHKDISVNTTIEAGRITEGDRQIKTTLFIKPELLWLWKFKQ